MKAIVLLVIAALPLAAQFSAEPPPADGPKQVVSGRVLDSRTSRPLRGAKVALWHRNGEIASTRSDFEGRFRFDQAPVGDWRIGVDKNGYLNKFAGIAVPSSQPLAGLELKVDRMAAIAGRVVDHRDRPVVGATVTALSRRYFEGESVYMRQGGRGPFGGRTDDRGHYRIWGLAAGSYVLAVFPAPQPAADGVYRFDAVGALHPSAHSIAEAEKLDLEWGEVREGVDLRLGPPAPTRAEGTITLPTAGETCQPCLLQLYLHDPEGPILIGGVPLSDTNRIRIEGAPPGRYLAQLSKFDRTSGRPAAGSQELTLSNNRTESFTLALSGELPLAGRLLLEDPPDDLFAEDRPWRTFLRLIPAARDMGLMNMGRGGQANVEVKGPDTSCSFGSLPGTFRLRLMDTQRAYIAGVAVDGRPLEDASITVPAEGLAGEITVRVRFDFGRVQGAVAGASPPSGPGLSGPGYILSAEPAGSSRAFLQHRFLRVQDDCSFDEALPPGSWDLVAIVANPWTHRLGDPAYEAALRKFIRRVEVRPNETTTVSLPPVPAL